MSNVLAAGSQIKRAAANPWLERAARLGYVVRGVLYGVMGFLALSLALGQVGTTPDMKGSLFLLNGNPLAAAFLVVVIVGLTAYSIWGFTRAIYDPLGRGHKPVGIAARLGFAWSGLSYAALVLFAAGFLVGATHAADTDSMQKLVRTILARPSGAIAITIAGVIGVATGLGQFVDAYRAGFKQDLQRDRMSRAERLTVDSLGRFGMFSRGVVFTLLGWFVLQAGLQHDASKAQGITVAFQEILRQPFGHMILAVVALGFVALGLHSFANAMWVRMLPTR
jgi:hypothetical protein